MRQLLVIAETFSDRRLMFMQQSTAACYGLDTVLETTVQCVAFQSMSNKGLQSTCHGYERSREHCRPGEAAAGGERAS